MLNNHWYAGISMFIITSFIILFCYVYITHNPPSTCFITVVCVCVMLIPSAGQGVNGKVSTAAVDADCSSNMLPSITRLAVRLKNIRVADQ